MDAPKPFNSLTHVDSSGAAMMVDVGAKSHTCRSATARSRIRMALEVANAIRDNSLAKGECLQVARIAAIQAVKWTCHLIPLCHSIPIDAVNVESQWLSPEVLEWKVTVKSFGKTGVEMEALTAASVAALTVYDMGKGMDHSITILETCLLEKTGGVRGDYVRSELKNEYAQTSPADEHE